METTTPELGSNVIISCYWGENEDNKNVNWYRHNDVNILRISVASSYREPDVPFGLRNKVGVKTMKAFECFIHIVIAMIKAALGADSH